MPELRTVASSTSSSVAITPSSPVIPPHPSSSSSLFPLSPSPPDDLVSFPPHRHRHVKHRYDGTMKHSASSPEIGLGTVDPLNQSNQLRRVQQIPVGNQCGEERGKDLTDPITVIRPLPSRSRSERKTRIERLKRFDRLLSVKNIKLVLQRVERTCASRS